MKKGKTDALRALTAQFYAGNRLNFVMTAASSLLLTCVNLVISFVMQQLIDTMSGAAGAWPLAKSAAMTLAVLAALVLMLVVNWFFEPRFMERAMRQYREYAFERLTQKGMAAFREEGASTYISAFSNDAAVIEENYLRRQFKLINNVVLFVGALTMMLAYSPLLTAIAVGLSALPFAASLLAGSRLSRAEEAVSRRNAELLAMLKDCLTGFSVIKGFRAERAMSALFARCCGETEAEKCRRSRIQTAVSGLGSLAGFVAQFGVFLAGACLALQGEQITAGVVLMFVNLMNFVISPIAEIPGILAGRKAALALMDKLGSALAQSRRDEGEPIGRALHQGIEVKQLSFGYEPGQTVLSGIDLSFAAGGCYAVVGGSGSGKSTLLSLLLGAHGGYAGDILYDGRELRGIGSDSLYDLISSVEQSVFVFNASIRDNITMFSEFPKEAVDRAIALSGLTELVARRGEDMLCGENGSELSGGERQRISIARSLLRQSAVLLADEATAALDAQTAYAVSDAILSADGLTRIVVTHRLEESLLRRYDGIVVLRHRRVEETGSYDELMARRGYFYSLCVAAA